MRMFSRGLVGGWLLLTFWLTGAMGAPTVEFSAPATFVPAITVEDVGGRVSLQLLNHSGESIPLRELKTSCGCLSAGPLPESIPANGSVKIDLSFRQKRKLGPFTVDIIAKAGSKGEEIASTVVQGAVLPASGLLVEPQELNFGRTTKGEFKERTISIVHLTKMGQVQVSGSENIKLEEQMERRVDDRELGTTTREFRVTLLNSTEESGKAVVDLADRHVVIPVKYGRVDSDLVIPSGVTIRSEAVGKKDIRILLVDGAEILNLPKGIAATAGAQTSKMYREYVLKLDAGLSTGNATRIDVPVVLGERKCTFAITIIE